MFGQIIQNLKHITYKNLHQLASKYKEILYINQSSKHESGLCRDFGNVHPHYYELDLEPQESDLTK